MGAALLRLLGPVRLSAIAKPRLGAKATAILAYLACQPGREAPREHVAALLWETGDARHALRQTLLELRRQLGDAADEVLLADTGRLWLAPRLTTDIDLFKSHLESGRMDAACALLRGRFCEGLVVRAEPFEEWLAGERARRDEDAAGAMEDLVRLAQQRGDTHVAIRAARRLVAADPFDDTAHARLIGLYRRQGWSGAARLAHRRCVGLFQRELGIAPSREVFASAKAPMPPLEHVPPPPGAAPAAPAPRMLPPAHARVAWLAPLIGAVLLAALAAATRGPIGPHSGSASAAPAAAWVGVDEWTAEAPVDPGGLSMAEAVDRAIAGDPAFAHLAPHGC